MRALYFASTFFAVLLGMVLGPLARAEIGSVRFTSTSPLLRPAEFTRSMQTQRLVLGSPEVANANHELVPGGNGFSSRYTVLEGDLVRDSGTLNLRAAVTDSDGDGLPDYLQIERPAALALEGATTSEGQGGTIYSVTGALSRDAGSASGTYTLSFTPTGVHPTDTNPNPPSNLPFVATGSWTIFGFNPATARIHYERALIQNTYSLELEGLSPETSGLISERATFSTANADAVTLDTVTLRTSDGVPIVFSQADLRRTAGTVYRGTRIVIPRSSGSSAWQGFSRWVVEVNDPNDSDRNGIPEISDPNRLFTNVVINRAGTSPAVTIGARLALTTTTAGRIATYQWFRDGVPIIGANTSSLTIESLPANLTFNPFTTITVLATADTGVTASDEYRFSVDAPRATLPLNAVAQPGALVPTDDPFNPLMVGPNAVVYHTNLPNAVRLELEAFGHTQTAGAEVTLVWRADFSVPAAQAGLGVKLVTLGGGLVEVQLIDPAQGILARAPTGLDAPLVIEDDGFQVRVGQRDRMLLTAATRFRRGQQLGLLGAPSVTAPQFALPRTYGLRAWSATWLQSPSTARAVNLSTRGFVGTGDRAMVAGVVMRAEPARSLLFRAIGPELRRFSVTDASPEIRLSLYQGPTLQAENFGWSSGSDSAAIAQTSATVGAFALTAGSRDSALLRALGSGSFTAQATGSGTGLVEVYDTQPSADQGPFVNLSTRGYIAGAEQPMIAGLVVRGDGARTFLVRATGPALRRFGLADTIADPRLAVYDGTGKLILANDDWTTLRMISSLETAFPRVGAFGLLATETKEAALLIRLPAGNYTIYVVSGDGRPGVALVEVYDFGS